MSEFAIKQGEDFSNVPVCKVISDYEISWGFWLFRRKSQTAPYLLIGLYRNGMMEFLQANGFYRLAADSSVLVWEQTGILNHIGMEELKGFIIQFLDDIPNEGYSFKVGRRSVKVSKEALRETYLRQCHLLINISFLEHLYPLPKEILGDDVYTAYVPFKNGIVEVKRDGILSMNYRDLKDKCVWKRHVIDREIPVIQTDDEVTCEFGNFIGNVAGGDVELMNAFRNGIGYMLHNYTKPSQAKAVILNDSRVTETGTPNGGTGKGIVANAIGQIRTVTRIDGKGYRYDNQFKYQQVGPETQIVWFDDPRPDFQFSDLFSVISEGLTVEKKNQAAFTIEPSRSPKFLLTSNTPLNSNGTSNTRRQYVLELEDHYLKLAAEGNSEPIVTEHGGRFFDKVDWDKEEWAAFDLYMLQCIRDYLAHGLVPNPSVHAPVNELVLKTDSTYVQWMEDKKMNTGLKYDTKSLFKEFKALHKSDDVSFTQRTFTKWLKLWASSKGWEHVLKPSSGRSKFLFKVA